MVLIHRTLIQEYFADYCPILPSLFSLNYVPSTSKQLYGPTSNSWNSRALELAIQGVTAVLLSLKKKPVIRYEKMSGMAKKLATEVQVGLGPTVDMSSLSELTRLAPYDFRIHIVRFSVDPSTTTAPHLG